MSSRQIRRRYVDHTRTPPLSDSDCQDRGWKRLPEAYFAWWHGERRVARVQFHGLLRSATEDETYDMFYAPYCVYTPRQIKNKRLVDCTAADIEAELREMDKIGAKLGLSREQIEYVVFLKEQLKSRQQDAAQQMADLFGED